MAKMSTEAFRARENNLLNRIQNDDIEAYRLLGDLYYKGPSGNENNENRAYTYWIQAADKGDPIAAGNVGIRMIQGVYGEEKRSEAYPYLKAAVKYADKYGSASMSAPFFWLGEAYASGIGCEYDLSTAEAFYTAAAQRNYPAAQLSLALLILNHKDSTDKTGLRWLCCAHINGNRKATKLLETKIKAPNPAWTQGEVDKTISDIFESGLFPISGIGFSQQIFEEIIQENNMAKYCTNCGTLLPANSKFCPECGTKVQDNEIRISEDGKGGLIFDVPEGTTVTISDEKPEE